MATAGRILIMPKGPYDASVTYEMLDMVSHDGATWLAKRTSVGIAPSDSVSDYWFKMVGVSAADMEAFKTEILETVSEMLSAAATVSETEENEQYNAIITEAYAERDASKRADLLHQAEELLLSDAPIVPVIFNTNAYAVSKELSKVKSNYWGAQIFTKATLKDYVQYLPSVKEARAKELEKAN